jgi:hypothetical protein
MASDTLGNAHRIPGNGNVAVALRPWLRRPAILTLPLNMAARVVRGAHGVACIVPVVSVRRCRAHGWRVRDGPAPRLVLCDNVGSESRFVAIEHARNRRALRIHRSVRLCGERSWLPVPHMIRPNRRQLRPMAHGPIPRPQSLHLHRVCHLRIEYKISSSRQSRIELHSVQPVYNHVSIIQ